MSITKQVFRGQFDQPQAGAAQRYELTCRLVTTQHGLESLHVTGWLAVDGAQTEVSLLGITSPGSTMHGRERAIALSHLAGASPPEPRAVSLPG